MADVLERCATCRALLDEEDLFCPNCGTEAPHRENLDSPPAAIIATHNFSCRGCGASMSYDASVQTLRCPFCGSEQLDQRQDEKTWAPKSVVPFVLTKDQAISNLKKWLREGFWRPGDLSEAAMVTKMAAVYVPYWVFAGRTFSNWTADSSQTPAGASGDWFPLSGEHRQQISGMLIGASGALTPAETSAICPFDLNRGVPPDQIDLENAVFEPFRVQRRYARPLAQQGFEDQVRQACQPHVPGQCRNLKVNVRIEELTSEAVLLPVWVAAYRYRDQVFRFLVNGQTGQVTGQAPTSWKKVAVAIGVILLCILVGMAVIALVAR